MPQHHEVVLAADAGLLVAAEGTVSGVHVVVVNPHAAGLNFAASTVAGVLVARPHTGTEAEVGVVRNLDSFLEVLERGHGEHRAEDLLAEDPHIVGALKHGGLDVVAVLQALHLVHVAADEGFRTFLRAHLEVLGDFVHLLLRGLGTHHGLSVERVTNLDLLYALHGQLKELVRDVLMDKRTRRASADLALVEGEHDKALDALL